MAFNKSMELKGQVRIQMDKIVNILSGLNINKLAMISMHLDLAKEQVELNYFEKSEDMELMLKFGLTKEIQELLKEIQSILLLKSAGADAALDDVLSIVDLFPDKIAYNGMDIKLYVLAELIDQSLGGSNALAEIYGFASAISAKNNSSGVPKQVDAMKEAVLKQKLLVELNNVRESLISDFVGYKIHLEKEISNILGIEKLVNYANEISDSEEIKSEYEILTLNINYLKDKEPSQLIVYLSKYAELLKFEEKLKPKNFSLKTLQTIQGEFRWSGCVFKKEPDLFDDSFLNAVTSKIRRFFKWLGYHSEGEQFSEKVSNKAAAFFTRVGVKEEGKPEVGVKPRKGH